MFNSKPCVDCGESVGAVAPALPADRCMSCSELAELRASTAAQAAEIEGLRRERDEAKFSPLGDNHHNAHRCPYCSPDLVKRENDMIAQVRSAESAEEALGDERRLSVAAVARAEAAESRVAELAAEVERVTRERDEARDEVPHPGDGTCENCGKCPSVYIPTSLCDECIDGVARAESAESRVAELTAALKPFAEAAGFFLPLRGDTDNAAPLLADSRTTFVTVGDFRRAARALSGPSSAALAEARG